MAQLWAEMGTGCVDLSPGSTSIFVLGSPENHSQALWCSGECANPLCSFAMRAPNPNVPLLRDRLITSMGFARSGLLCYLSARH